MAERDSVCGSVANSEAAAVFAVSAEASIRVDIFIEALDMSSEYVIPLVESIGSIPRVFGYSGSKILFGGRSEVLKDEVVT